MFWTLAAAVLFIGLVIALFPLLRGRSALQPLALALAFALPAAGLWIYNSFGTPEGIDVQGVPRPQASSSDPHSMESGEMSAMVADLRARLAQNPGDLDGWMLLSRSLKTTRQYDEAARALETAHGLAPENPAVMVELAEAWVFLSADGQIPDRSVSMLERALGMQPTLQKGLWLMGIAQSQRGDDAFAISYWQSLLELLEPGSDIARTVQQQIGEAQARMGMSPDTPAMPAGHPEIEAPAVAEDGSWSGTRLVVTASDGAQQALDSGAVMYVMIRSPGPAMGPPLGVRRVERPELPLELTITDQDSMMQERLISTEKEVQLQVRISVSGAPNAAAGDWQSATQTVELAGSPLVVLNVDEQL
jgi:cytochrome c-type biogenesis protein CcmH